ncbi:hypothetical protein DH2020_029227 [Rehmannia glutinosa]|uniref:Uncharacterized protein n=1 Tax=Rehmannia glutinosa TaxID=99300 RepID=A0ABR0VQX9_REHGL
MGSELLDIGIKMRKGVIFTIRGCFRSVCNHPFLVGFLCFLILLYRSSPVIFSLLVSASPILVCTFVLLGVLLSFGEPNIPDIEIEEKKTFEAVSMKTGVLGDAAAVVEKNDSYFVERFSDKGDEQDQSIEVRREDRSDVAAPLIKERSREIESNGGEIWEENGVLSDLSYKQKTEWIDERLNDKVLESDDDKSETDSFGSEKVNVDSLDSPPRSPWKRVEERDDEEEEEDERDEEDDASDSGSGGAESSSPDASMADIMPMLDELHPLLDEETPQPVHMSPGGSDAASEKSSKSSTNSHELDDETENHEDLEVADDDNEDVDDEEDAQGDKEEETKSAITWTEEDQKNLMDLGSSEIERNQRLENLILRRRARKNMSVYPERNLIDLESSVFPFSLAPISTRRQNPFDLPHDSYDNSGLPPIPGSAPSILLPRQNPFDIPYDSSEEKPDLMGDGFKEEFTTFQSRDQPFFRRHESFNVGPSIFAPNRRDVRMRPYFVPEGTVSEESSYSPFQRQSSELSESKVSSVPETESIGSVEDLEHRRLSEEDNRPEVEAEGPSGDRESNSQQEENTEEDVNKELEMISDSETESVSEHVGHGSQSSEEEESLELDQVEKGEVEISELEFQLENVADDSVTRPVEVQATEYHSNYEGVEQVYRRDSSSSSLSEVSERVFTVTETDGEGLLILEERRVGVAQEQESTDLSTEGTLVTEIPHREPVYDLSPREIRNDISSSSISSVGRESEGNNQEIETNIPSNVEILPESSITHPVDESRPTDVVDIREHDNVKTDFSRSESEGSSATLDIISNMSIPFKSSVEASVEENLVEQDELGEVPGSRADEDIHNLEKSSVDQSLEEKFLLMSGEERLIEVSEPSFEGQPREDRTIGSEETVLSPNSDGDVYHGADEKLISTPSSEESSAQVESSEDIQITQNSNMHEVQELDHDISSYINSPLSPDFISIQSNTTETTDSRVNVQTIVEEADDMNEIDEQLLSELDNVGDFSVQQLGSGSSEFDKRIGSVEERNSTIRVADVNSVEENEIEDAVRTEKSREDVDIHEEDVEYISESKTSRAEYIAVSGIEFDERESQYSPWETSEDETPTKEYELSYEDNISGKPELEVRAKEDVDSVSKKAELTSAETEITVGDAEVSRGMTEFEASTTEDIDLAFKQIEMEEPIDLEAPTPPQAEPVVKATLTEQSKNGALHEKSSVMGSTHETSVLEVKPIKDATLDSEQLNDSDSVDRTSEFNVADNIPSEGTTTTTLSPNQALDGKSLKQLKPNSDDGSVEVKADEMGSSKVQEIGVAAEKPEQEVEAPKNLHSTASVKGKGKISESSSSSSSSSSESSSSDSDRE